MVDDSAYGPACAPAVGAAELGDSVIAEEDINVFVDITEADLTDIVDKRIFRVAEYLKTGRIVSDVCVHHLPGAIWEMTHTALASLRHYIESPLEPDISWEKPCVEARWPVAWDWERDQPCFFPFDRSDYEGETDDVADRLGGRVANMVRGWALHFVTHRLVLKSKGDSLEHWLPFEDLEALATLDAESQEYFNRIIERPITIFGDHRDPQSTIARAEIADGTARFDRCAAAQITITATEDDGQRILGSAYPLVQFYPLVVDEIDRVAYFPMVAGIVLDDQLLESGVLDSSEWAEVFWKETLGLIEAHMLDEQNAEVPPPVSELPADVDQAHREERLVVVPKISELQREVVRKVRGYALKLAGTVELTGKLEIDRADAALRRREVPGVPLPSGVTWSHLSIEFTASDTVRIEVAERFSRVYTFGELGFRDNRTQGVPNTRWALLRSLAEKGEISWSKPPGKLRQDRVKAAIGDLRAHLKELFSIDADPFEDYRTAKAYRPRFVLRMDDRLLDRSDDVDD